MSMLSEHDLMCLRLQLERDEDYRQHPYRDTVGKLTIGFGRNLDDVGIDRSEASYMLSRDIARVKTEVLDAYPWAVGLDGVRFGVLLNMAYNMGLGGLGEFVKMLSAFEAGDWQKAAVEMLDSDYAAQVGDRAKRLARQVITGQWQ